MSTFSFPEGTDSQAMLEALAGKAESPVVQTRAPTKAVRPLVLPDRKDHPSVPNVQPGPAPASSADYYPVVLPTKCAYYDFKDLYVTPFRTVHLGKLAKSHETANMHLLLEVVSSVLAADGQTDLAFKLSTIDFKSVMMWLKFNTGLKPKMVLVGQCTDEQHLQDVQAGKLKPESLKITTVVDKTMVIERAMDTIPDPAQFSVTIGDLRVPLRPETMWDLVQFIDDPNWADEEYAFNAQIASVLDDRVLGTKTLAEKIELVSQMSIDDAMVAQRFKTLTETYGVAEYVETRCGVCGARHQQLVAVDAQSFFRPQD